MASLFFWHCAIMWSPRYSSPYASGWEGATFSSFRGRHSGPLVLGYTFTLYYGTLRLRQYPPYATAALQSESVNVALVTAHSPSAQRWQRVHYGGNLLNYIDATQQGITSRQSDLIVWPEFAVGFYLDREPALQAQIGRLTRRANAPLLLGAPRTSNSEAGPNYYNTAYFISANGRLQDVYDKIRLLPFAEFRPFSLPALVSHRHERLSLFTPGERTTIFSLPKGDFGVMICYEATYPYLARRLVQRGAQFLVNISNDVWLSYGGPAAAQQHFAISVFRAVETKRSLARVATAGLSGFVDPAGRRASLSVATSGVTFDCSRSGAHPLHALWRRVCLGLHRLCPDGRDPN
ncbi:apolipoprotein N-acyltransferase [Candidatus Entotheonella serta]|nr:apolipoprotein N-acyltransferase [Candidatus Entotheonella serta]